MIVYCSYATAKRVRKHDMYSPEKMVQYWCLLEYIILNDDTVARWNLLCTYYRVYFDKILLWFT